MDRAEFLRLYRLRAPNMMWFLGAGASAGAGVPTAGEMVWEFKRDIYCSRESVAPRLVGDLGDPAVRRVLQRYFDEAGGFPVPDDPEEYAVYFEEAYPNEADRRRYLDARVSGARPSSGHYALAALLEARRARAVWMTNVDRVLEDASAVVHGGTGGVAVATLSAPEIAREALDEGTRPVVGKLHGDYMYRRLMNTLPELREQDARLREALVDACRHSGLVVVGYSGRDSSVMAALTDGIAGGRGFSNGLFWVCRAESRVLPAVRALIEAARAEGVQAEIIEVPTFDEFATDVVRLEPHLPAELTRILNEQRPRRLVEATIPSVQGRYPVVRLNAVRIVEAPTLARFAGCAPPTWPGLREAVARAGVPALAVPTRGGVLAFGADDDVRTVLSGRPIREFDVRPLSTDDRPAEEVALLGMALAAALARGRALRVERTRSRTRLVIADAAAAEFSDLRQLLGELSGTVPGLGLKWAEGLDLILEDRLGVLWLVLDPSVWVERGRDEDRYARTAFVNGRYERRYNRESNDLLAAWVRYLVGDAPRTFNAFADMEGVNATFKIDPVTAYSARMEVSSP